MANLPLTVIDGNFANAVEIEGSPTFAIDEVTYARIITRRFAVLKSAYLPLPQGTKDPQIKNAVLVSEATDSVEGPIMKFHRIYAEVPGLRTERRIVAFTLPGMSAAQVSNVSGQAIGWDKYGAGAPMTKLLSATVTFSYQVGAPTTVCNVSKITYGLQGVYNGVQIYKEVDFAGSVYVFKGMVTVLGMSGPVTEPRWVFDGVTNPPQIPNPWLVSTNIRRWMGPIWETENVTVPTAFY